MKIILSRKGFDSSNGGCPSPIMPDGTLLSLPIPCDTDRDRYEELCYNGMTYRDILSQINPGGKYDHCHVDPDIRENIRSHCIKGWQPAFGQIGAAQGVLRNAKVEIGDIFLFFGWFRQTEIVDGRYRFVKGSRDLHVIYGYMQIGDIITSNDRISQYCWHPHASYSRIANRTNALYIPAEKISLVPDKSGYGTLGFRHDRVLTMKGKNRGTWNEYSFLLPQHVYGNKKNSAKGSGLYYSGIWQELVVYESDGLIEWVKGILYDQ